MKTYNILSIDEFKTKIESNSRLLGIDPGSKNIGFAICDENKKIATPLIILDRVKNEILIEKINHIIEENQIKGIVIGNPVNMDGSKGKASVSAIKFGENLSRNITIPITFWDERLSSEGSFKITKELGTNVSNRLNKLDKNAAAFILQGALDYLSI
jgi:putative Holliday junction resolvase